MYTHIKSFGIGASLLLGVYGLFNHKRQQMLISSVKDIYTIEDCESNHLMKYELVDDDTVIGFDVRPNVFTYTPLGLHNIFSHNDRPSVVYRNIRCVLPSYINTNRCNNFGITRISTNTYTYNELLEHAKSIGIESNMLSMNARHKHSSNRQLLDIARKLSNRTYTTEYSSNKKIFMFGEKVGNEYILSVLGNSAEFVAKSVYPDTVYLLSALVIMFLSSVF